MPLKWESKYRTNAQFLKPYQLLAARLNFIWLLVSYFYRGFGLVYQTVLTSKLIQSSFHHSCFAAYLLSSDLGFSAPP